MKNDLIIAKATRDGARYLLRASGRVSVRAAGDSIYRMAGRVAVGHPTRPGSSAAEALAVWLDARKRQFCCVCLDSTDTYTTATVRFAALAAVGTGPMTERRFHFCAKPACHAQGQAEGAR